MRKHMNLQNFAAGILTAGMLIGCASNEPAPAPTDQDNSPGGPAVAQGPSADVPSGDDSLSMGAGGGEGRAKGYVPGAPGAKGSGRTWDSMEKVRSVREQQNAFVAQELVNQGRQQLAENNTREAWRNFTQAAELDPTNTEARRQ